MRHALRFVTPWEIAFGNTVREQGTFLHYAKEGIPSKVLKFRDSLHSEEGLETTEALSADKLLLTADGIMDTLWVMAGTIATLGLDYDKQWRVHAVDIIEEQLAELSNIALEVGILCADDWEEEYNRAIVQLEMTLRGLCAILRINYELAFEEVYRSNMSKFGEDGKPVRNPETSKIIKGPNFTEPNLEPFVQRKPGDEVA
jgi:predicted HAD superfamily Cof-like phosphohydrolase